VQPSADRSSRAAQLVALLGFLLLSAAAAFFGASIGADNTRTWYPTLAAPPLQPPSWLFGPVWTLLYTLMAVAAWRIWRRYGWDRSLTLYLVHLALNAAWTAVFFAMRRMDLALVDILALDVTLALTVVMFWRRDRVAGLLLAPTLAWVLFASYLNAGFWLLNR
jgi:tryptophan-rich sensory protein